MPLYKRRTAWTKSRDRISVYLILTSETRPAAYRISSAQGMALPQQNVIQILCYVSRTDAKSFSAVLHKMTKIKLAYGIIITADTDAKRDCSNEH